MSWIDQLPSELQKGVNSLIKEYPKSEPVLLLLAAHYTSNSPDKRRKTNLGKVQQALPKSKKEDGVKTEQEGSLAGPKVEVVSEHVLNINAPINANEVIFELPGLSFLSPIRRKLNLVFHLYISSENTALPVLSVVNPSTTIPEISVTNLLSAIRLCVIVPILGNSTVSTKKDTVMMALWLHESAALTDGKNEPIICTLNLDQVKKQLMADGKIPAHAEAQILGIDSDPNAIKPINELIIDFLQRQFNLCGVKLINFLPSANLGKNSLNMNDDNVICLSQNSDTHNDLVMAGAYKGSKEGALLLVSNSTNSAFLIFGFKKPVLIMDFTSLKTVSYSNITRFTFSMLVTMVNAEGVEESHEFGMIDQKSFQAIDEFVKRMNIDDNSFDEKHREKRTENKADSTESELPEQPNEGPAASDDEEEDGTYTGAVEEDESGSEVDEEYDSNAESGSDSASEDESNDEDKDNDDEPGKDLE